MAAVRLPPRVFALLLTLTAACRSPPRGPIPPSAPPATPVASASVPAAIGVRLIPHSGTTEIASFVLENAGPSELDGLHPWPGLTGHFERRGSDGRWFVHAARGGYCATVAATGPLGPGASLHVGELPALGEHLFPPGRYRFVLPYVEVGRPGTEQQVVLPFSVEGLGATESAALIDALKSRVCPWNNRAFLLEVVERTAAPEALPRLLELPAVSGEPFAQRLAPLEVLARRPELADLLVNTVEHGESSIAVPVAIALLRETPCSPESKRCGTAVTRLAASLGEKDEPRPEAIDALARTWETWPPTVAGALIQLLARTASDDVRVSVADALAGVGRSDVKRLGPHPRTAVVALRRTAGRTRDRAVRDRILEDAHDIAEAIGDEPPRDQTGVALFPLGEDWNMSEECAQFLAGLAPLLRFARPNDQNPIVDLPGTSTEMVVHYGASSVEPYRAAAGVTWGVRRSAVCQPRGRFSRSRGPGT